MHLDEILSKQDWRYQTFLGLLKKDCSEYLANSNAQGGILYRGRGSSAASSHIKEADTYISWGVRPIVTGKSNMNEIWNYNIFDLLVEKALGIKNIRENSTYATPDMSTAMSFGETCYVFPVNGSKALVGSDFRLLDVLNEKFVSYMRKNSINGTTSYSTVEQLKQACNGDAYTYLLKLAKECDGGYPLAVVDMSDTRVFENVSDNPEVLIFDAPHYYMVSMPKSINYRGAEGYAILMKQIEAA